MFFYLFVALSHVLQQQGRYEDDFVPTESSLQALEGEDFMMNFFSTVSMLICMLIKLSWEMEQIKMLVTLGNNYNYGTSYMYY